MVVIQIDGNEVRTHVDWQNENNYSKDTGVNQSPQAKEFSIVVEYSVPIKKWSTNPSIFIDTFWEEL